MNVLDELVENADVENIQQEGLLFLCTDPLRLHVRYFIVESELV